MVQQTLVFISHTQSMRTRPAGATSFVDGADEAVNSVEGAKAFHMSFFPAADQAPADYSLHQLSKADLFLAIVGFDRGSQVPGDRRSYTELEFDGATQLRRPRLIFLLHPDSAHLEGIDPTRVAEEQLRFRHRLETSGATVAYFSDVGDLKYRVRQAVDQAVRERRSAHQQPYQPPPPPPWWRRLAVVLAVVVALGGVGWLGYTGWNALTGDGACTQLTASVRSSQPEVFAGLRGARLEVAVQNDSDSDLVLPSSIRVSGRGAQGRQYAASQAFADQSWFRQVTVPARSTSVLQLGLESGVGGTDDVTLDIPDVRTTNRFFGGCTVNSSPARITFDS